MSEGKRLTRKDYLEAHEPYTFRRFVCSGSCGMVVEALSAGEVFCCQPGCRGVMKASYRLSSRRLANDQYETARDRDETPRFTPQILGVLASERPWNSSGDGPTPPGGFEGLIEGIAKAQELVIEAFIQDPDGEWLWAPGVGGGDA